ncbi:MAG: ribosome small subunit-dependent GTPase A [Bacillota bacterium]|jgi:ribosome biogenesis GTPase|nr:MAG: ribosome small subunit-dependent GTPase A [Bacillota bacterium]
MPGGRVIRAYSNVYYVDTGDEVLECRPRGRLKLRDTRVLVGDLVRVSQAGPGLGAIDEVLPRRNALARPQVANVDQAVIVLAVHEPELELLLADRFLVLAAAAELEAILCLNKVDLACPGEVGPVVKVYEDAGYLVVATSAKTGEGLAALRSALARKVSVLAGPSGVGKSSLLNALNPDLRLRTGEVSRKVRRGTHTTRHVALVPVGSGGLVADTPGFTQLELDGIPPQDIAWFFPEIAALAPRCKFRGCAHRAEPECRVKEGVAEGLVDGGRYARYLELVREAEATYRAY